MESNDEWKDIDIKNRTCYHINDIITIEDFHFSNVLINEKSYENILVYDISYKTLIGAKPLRIRLKIFIILSLRHFYFLLSFSSSLKEHFKNCILLFFFNLIY